MLKIDTIDIAEELTRMGIDYENKGANTILIRCQNPKHADNNPSCVIYKDTKRFHCKSCNASGNIVKLIWLHYKRTKTELAIEQDIAKRYGLKYFGNEITLDRVHGLHLKLLENSQALDFLIHKKRLTMHTIEAYLLGFENRRVTIPIPDEANGYAAIIGYLPNARTGEQKFLKVAGRKSDILYPFEQLEYPQIVLFGGEVKALRALPDLNAVGIGAVSLIGGERGLSANCKGMILKGDRDAIAVCMDIDGAGRNAAETICKQLRPCKGLRLFNIRLSLDANEFPKGDINDIAGDVSSIFKDAIANDNEYTLQSKEQLSDKKVHTTTLERALTGEYHNDVVQIVASFDSMADKKLAYAGKAVVSCPPTNMCVGCPNITNPENRCEIDLPTHGSEAITMLAGGKGDTREVTDRLFRSCKNYTVELKDTIAAYKCTIASGEVKCPAFVIGNMPEGEELEIKAQVVKDREGAEVVVLAFDSKPFENAIDTTEFHRLHVDKPTVEGILDKLNSFARHNAAVTTVENRRDYLIWVHLWLHSVKSFKDINGNEQIGAMSLLVVGDTGTGKSLIAKNIFEHYKLSKSAMLQGPNSTFAGIVGSTIQTRDGWKTKRGAMGRFNGKELLIEEIGQLSGHFDKLANVMSEGRVTSTKSEAMSHEAIVRIMMIGNPKYREGGGSWYIKNYHRPSDVMIEILGTPEILRRITFCYAFQSGGDTDQVSKPELLYPQELLINSQRAARQRVVNLQISQDALDSCCDKLDKAFACDLPILGGDITPIKLQQVACAIASATCTNIVSDVHLQVACELFFDAYRGSLKLDERASEHKKDYTKAFLYHLSSAPKPRELAGVLESCGGMITKDIIITFFAATPWVGNTFISGMLSCRGLVPFLKRHNCFTISEKLMEFLKTHKDKIPEVGTTHAEM